MPAKKQTSDTHVTRIKASSSKSETSKTKTVDAKKPSRSKTTSSEKSGFNPISAILGYFKGAWTELRQVHWPTRRATWGLTVAVLLFSLFFVVVVLLLDGLFKYLFELVLG